MADSASDSAVMWKHQKRSIVCKHFERKESTQFVNTVVNRDFVWYEAPATIILT